MKSAAAHALVVAPQRAWLAASLALCLAAPAAAATSGDPLGPYRHFARTQAAARLVAAVRSEMERYYTSERADSTVTPNWPGAPAGIYVSLVAGRSTRACVGSTAPLGGTLGESVRALAVQALQADRRRPPIRRDELDQLRVVISFAAPGSPVSDPMTVQPGREGLLVTTPRGSVAFLPGEARTVSWALREARRAGVLAGDGRDASYQRFDVVSIAEPLAPPEPRSPDDP